MPSSHPFLVLVLLGVASVALSETVLQQLTHCRLDENVVAFNWALRKHSSPDDEWGGPQYTGRPDPLHVVVKSTYCSSHRVRAVLIDRIIRDLKFFEVNLQDINAMTALDWAAKFLQLDVVETLLRLGASPALDPYRPHHLVRLPIDHALEHRPGVSEEYVLPVVELLYESMGPNYNFSSPSCPECPSPVDVATELRFFRIARMLQAKPAGLPGYDRRGATRPARPRHRPDQPPDLIVSATLGVIAAITIAIALRHLRT